MLRRPKVKHPLLGLAAKHGDPSHLMSTIKDASSTASIHALKRTVSPHHVSRQVGASLDPSGSWRHVSSRDVRLVNGVDERKLLVARDLNGRPLDQPPTVIQPRPAHALRKATMPRAQSAGPGRLRAAPAVEPASAACSHVDRPTSASASPVTHSADDFVSPGELLAMGLRRPLGRAELGHGLPVRP